jgi:hypothetical protein
LANENADVAYNGSIRHDTPLIQDGISFRHGDAAVRAANGYVVLGCHVRLVHRCSNHHVRVILDNEEKEAHGAAGKARKNAYVHAYTPSV